MDAGQGLYWRYFFYFFIWFINRVYYGRAEDGDVCIGAAKHGFSDDYFYWASGTHFAYCMVYLAYVAGRAGGEYRISGFAYTLFRRYAACYFYTGRDSF